MIKIISFKAFNSILYIIENDSTLIKKVPVFISVFLFIYCDHLIRKVGLLESLMMNALNTWSGLL